MRQAVGQAVEQTVGQAVVQAVEEMTSCVGGGRCQEICVFWHLSMHILIKYLF